MKLGINVKMSVVAYCIIFMAAACSATLDRTYPQSLHPQNSHGFHNFDPGMSKTAVRTLQTGARYMGRTRNQIHYLKLGGSKQAEKDFDLLKPEGVRNILEPGKPVLMGKIGDAAIVMRDGGPLRDVEKVIIVTRLRESGHATYTFYYTSVKKFWDAFADNKL